MYQSVDENGNSSQCDQTIRAALIYRPRREEPLIENYIAPKKEI